MLSRRRLARDLLHRLLGNIAQRDHAHRLPDAQTDARHDAAVEALHAALAVDVLESVADGHLFGAVGVVFLALHFHAHHFDRLVPGGETAAESGGEDLLGHAELDAGVFFAADFADAGFAVRDEVLVWLCGLFGKLTGKNIRNTTQTESATPVRNLPDSNGVDALVDASQTLAAVDVHESGHGAGGLDAGLDGLVLGHLDRLHARAEAHGGVGLRQTARHAAQDAGAEVVGAEGFGVEFGLGGDEEEHGALGGGFDPGPGDEALVDCGMSLVICDIITGA